MACAAGAVLAPAAGAAPVVVNTHDIGVDPTALTYTDDSAAGSNLALTLTPDPVGGNDVVFGASALTTPLI